MKSLSASSTLIVSFLLSLSVVTNSIARPPAEGCTPTRLDAPGYSMEHVPPAYQQTGNCFAVAAAQAYDAYRFSHGDKRYHLLTSRFDLTFRNAKSNKEKEFGGGGMFREVMDLLSNEPPCPLKRRDLIGEEKEIDRLEKFAADAQEQILSMQKQSEEYALFRNMSAMRLEGIDVEPLSVKGAKNALASCAEDSRLSSRRIRGVDGILGIIENRDVMDFLVKTVKTTCKDSKRLHVNPPYLLTSSRLRGDGLPYDEIEAETFPWQKNALRMIQENLSLGKEMAQPQAISFCSTVLDEYTENSNDLGKKFRTKECGAHAALVIGQRVNPKTGKCDFLLRNSWGKTYGKYSEPWEEERGKGNVWVDAEILMRNTYRLDGIH